MGSRPQPNIWQLQSQRNIPAIIRALDDLDPSVRRRAILALRALEATEAIPHLQRLQEREFNPEIRTQIETALQMLGRTKQASEKAPETDKREDLLKRLDSHDADTLLTAINDVVALDDRTLVEPLVVIFRNPTHSAMIRLAAAEALLKMESAPATVALLGALRKEDWQVRRNAAAVLGQLEADWCVDPLIQLVKSDPHPTVRKTAAAALRRINTPEARRALRTMEPLAPQPSRPDMAESGKVSERPAESSPTPPASPPGTGSLPPLELPPAPRWARPRSVVPSAKAPTPPPPQPGLPPAPGTPKPTDSLIKPAAASKPTTPPTPASLPPSAPSKPAPPVVPPSDEKK